MAVLFGILEELTFHEVAKEPVSPALEGDRTNPLRAWANALRGAARPSDMPAPGNVYTTRFRAYRTSALHRSRPAASAPERTQHSELTPVPTGYAQPALHMPPRAPGRPCLWAAPRASVGLACVVACVESCRAGLVDAPR